MKKIAVPVTPEFNVNDHFGHCAYYQIFSINENNEVVFVEMTDAPEGCGCKSGLAQQLKKSGVSVLLAGGIGQGALNKLAEQGITVVRNCEGNALNQVKFYLEGKLLDGGVSCQSHAEGHTCQHGHE